MSTSTNNQFQGTNFAHFGWRPSQTKICMYLVSSSPFQMFQLYAVWVKCAKSFLGAVWYDSLSNTFQFLNNIIRIFTHFFTHTYFQKI